MKAARSGIHPELCGQLLPERLCEIGERNDHSVVQTPENVMKLGAVPDANHEEDHQVGNSGRKHASEMFAVFPHMLRAPFAELLHWLQQSERIEQIIAHPRAE